MTFVDDEGNEIETSGEIAITKQSVSFFNSKIKGDVSTTFTIDNNSKNRKTLGYYGPQMLNQIAYTKQAFNRVRNGNVLDRGFIVIQDDNGPTLSCFYVSGNSNWVQLLNDLITELDYSGITNGRDYSLLLNSGSVTSRTSATEGIIFPYVDWVYNYNKGNNYYFMLGGSLRIIDSKNDYEQATFFDFYPCLYLHTLVKEIANQSGLKLSGNLFDDALFNSIVIPPSNGQMKRNVFKKVFAVGSDQDLDSADGTVKYVNLSELTDPENLFSNNRYTSNKNALVKIVINNIVTDGSIITISIVKNGSVFLSSYTTTTIGNSGIKYETALVINDYIEIFVDVSVISGSGTIRFNVSFENPEMITIGDYVEPSNFLPDIKCIDLLKNVINYLGCCVYFNDTSRTLSINIIDKIKQEDSYDWSNYYISHKSKYTVDQAEKNYIRLNYSNTEQDIVKYNSVNTLKYGEGLIETQATIKDTNDISKLLFSPSNSDITDTNNVYTTNVNLIDLIDDGDPVSFTSVANVSTGVSRFTFSSGPVFFVSEVIRISSAASQNLGYFIVKAVTSTTIDVYFEFVSTFSGTIRKQSINYKQSGFRFLTVKPSSSISDFSQDTSFTILNDSGTTSTITQIPFAHFTKRKTNLPIDQCKNNLAIDNPNSGGFEDPTIKELYFNKISRFLQNPDIECQMLLPEAAFQRFQFDRFIYLKTENLTGYFFVESIENYIDGNTPVTVNLYML